MSRNRFLDNSTGEPIAYASCPRAFLRPVWRCYSAWLLQCCQQQTQKKCRDAQIQAAPRHERADAPIAGIDRWCASMPSCNGPCHGDILPLHYGPKRDHIYHRFSVGQLGAIATTLSAHLAWPRHVEAFTSRIHCSPKPDSGNFQIRRSFVGLQSQFACN